MFENVALGIIQGITEWLPLSSEGILVLVKTYYFETTESLESLINQSLFLHLGTFFAALVYFAKDVGKLLIACGRFGQCEEATKKTLIFLVTSTLISGLLGIGLVKGLSHFMGSLEMTGKIVTFLVGLLLLITGYFQTQADGAGYKKLTDLQPKDGILLGIIQGFAVLPGLSRSGLTVAVLLLRKFDEKLCIKLSFLMSLPIVLGGNLILNIQRFEWSLEAMAGLLCSFLAGIITIHLLLKLAQKIRFGPFILFFGILTVLASII